MAEQRFSFTERRAFLEAYDRKCAYCHEAVTIRAVQIDHVIPEHLDSKPEELAAVRKEYGLEKDFGLRSDLNLVPACPRCNGEKNAQLYRPDGP
jgi:5-methylcytosine-specific restriction endonuclease McrA